MLKTSTSGPAAISTMGFHYGQICPQKFYLSSPRTWCGDSDLKLKVAGLKGPLLKRQGMSILGGRRTTGNGGFGGAADPS